MWDAYLDAKVGIHPQIDINLVDTQWIHNEM